MDQGAVNGIGFTLFMVAFIALFVGSLVQAWHEAGREVKRREKEQNEWLAAEKAKNRWFLRFILLDGTIKQTNLFEPHLLWDAGSQYNPKWSSQGLAQNALEVSYKNGHFADETGKTYPACNIKEAWILEDRGSEVAV